MTRKILLVDLNNFARYPTLPIGYLASVLRGSGAHVEVFAPLMVGVQGVTREARPHPLGLVAAKLNYRVATSSPEWMRNWRERWANRRRSGINAHQDAVVEAFRRRLQDRAPDLVLVSSYLMYRDVCERLCALCSAAGVPVVIGGPYFAQPEVIAEWLAMPGLSALVAGEVELRLPAIVDALFAGNDLAALEGVLVRGHGGEPRGRVAAPLQDLDAVPYPDYSDFPWSAYPQRIVPVVTGRGCGWGACTFCSDVTSSAGRTYRSRSPANVLGELAQHHRRHDVSRFVFTDLKLNSNVQMWRSIIGGIQDAAPRAQWIGAVHAGTEADNGLSDADLRAAAKSGCVRLTTGLESGSQRMADLMKKGTRLEGISAFLDGAARAGISSRCTMILGYPGETVEDVHASTRFLAAHRHAIERVSLNRMQVIAGTALHRALKHKPQKFGDFRIVHEDPRTALVSHRDDVAGTRAHRQAVMGLLTEVHRINVRELSPCAREFEGVM